MQQKPLHYDGSMMVEFAGKEETMEPLKITDEMRKNIGNNPYSSIQNK